MAGVVGDGEHLVAQRRHQQQIDLGKHARHFLGHFAAQAIGLNEIHRRQEARFAEQVRPSIGNLYLELIGAPVEHDLLECRCAFREQNHIERLVGPVRQRDRGRDHAEFSGRLQCGAVDIGGRVFLHPCRHIADLQTLDRCARFKVELARHTADIALVGSGDGLQDQHGILDSARHRAELVERPAQRHRTGARHATKRGAQAGDPAAHRGADDAATGFAADRKRHQAGCGGRTRTCARTGGALLQQPRVHGLATEPDIVQRQCAQAQLGNQHCAGSVETRDHRGIFGRYAILERLGAPGGGDAGGIEQILHAIGNAVQRPTIVAGSNFLIGFFGLRQCMVGGERDDATQLRIETLDALEIDARKPLGGQRAGLDPARKFAHWREGDVVIIFR